MAIISRTVKRLSDGVAGLLTGVDLNNVSDLFGKFEEALSTLQQKATLPEGKTSQLYTLYDGVTDYIAPTPNFGSSVVDIQPIGQPRQDFDVVQKVGVEDFDRLKQYLPSGYRVALETSKGVNMIRIKSRFTPTRIVIDPMSDTTGWTASTATPLVLDSYSETNQDNFYSIGNTLNLAAGQAFYNRNNVILDSCKLYIKKIGSPTGNVTVKLFAMGGTFGSSAVPTGSALATADVLNIATLTTSFAVKTFSFSGAQRITLSADTHYCLVVYYSGGDGSNALEVGRDASSPSHSGNAFFSNDGTTFTAQTIYDMCFYVYGANIAVSGLVADQSFYYFNPASLRFTLSGVGIGYLEKTLTQSIDLTRYQNVGVSFLELELPALNLTSVEFRIGTDSSNYYSVTQTQGQMGAWTTGKFLDTPFDLSTATTVGSPTITDINYVKLTFVTTATLTNIRCGYLSISLPSQHEIFFTTTGMFLAADGSINNFITADDDVILLNDASYNLYKHECAMSVGFGEGGTLSGGLLATINSKLNGARARNGQVIQLGLYDKFRADNPSEDIRMVGNWYD